MKTLAGCMLAAVLLLAGCDKDDSSDTFTNQITLGTGLNSGNFFELTGEGTVFPAGALLYFRLESKEDMNGSDVRLRIENLSTSQSQVMDYAALQDYGHIYISSFTAPAAGNYSVTGILVDGNKTIASLNMTLQ